MKNTNPKRRPMTAREFIAPLLKGVPQYFIDLVIEDIMTERCFADLDKPVMNERRIMEIYAENIQREWKDSVLVNQPPTILGFLYDPTSNKIAMVTSNDGRSRDDLYEDVEGATHDALNFGTRLVYKVRPFKANSNSVRYYLNKAVELNGCTSSKLDTQIQASYAFLGEFEKPLFHIDMQELCTSIEQFCNNTWYGRTESFQKPASVMRDLLCNGYDVVPIG